MVSKLSAGLVLPLAVSAALPLHRGRQWTWRVTGYALPADGGLRTLVVGDSAADSTGTLWSLTACDSASGTKVPTRILQLPDGRQFWLEKISLMDWELGPPGESRDTVVHAGGALACRWAAPGAACGSRVLPWTMWYVVDDRVRISECFGIGACFYRDYPVPTGEWSASRGMLSSQVHTDGHDVEWRLVALDGIPVVDSGRTTRVERRASAPASLSELCRAHPEATVRWNTVDGRGGVVPAGEFERMLGKGPRRVFRIEALFPEGAWTGRVLTR